MRVKLLISAAVLSLSLVAGIYLAGSNRGDSSTNITGLLWPDPPKLGAFSLVDAHGNALTEKELLGRWTLLFFGFTNCPDICPTTMATLNEVYKQSQIHVEIVEKIQVLFVSVDPERDGTEILDSYVSYFNSEFIGVTASKENLAQFTRQFGIAYMKVKIPGSADYSMDHTASILLVDPELRFVGIFSRPHEATDITKRLVQIASFVADNG
jgi:protein SCO1/2